MLMVSENDRDSICHAKAKQRGQKTFTLVEQDITAPGVICDWISRNIYTCPKEKLREALEAAIAMRDSDVKKKDAD